MQLVGVPQCKKSIGELKVAKNAVLGSLTLLLSTWVPFPNKVSCSLLVGTLWPVVRIRRRLGTKGSQLWLLGLVHWQASCPLSTPSGQDVSCSEEESHQSRHLLQERGPLPGPKTGLLSNTQK